MPFNLYSKLRGFHVGIELEFEDPCASNHAEMNTSFGGEDAAWHLEPDGSLRYGAELVSNPLPYPHEYFDDAMRQLDTLPKVYPDATVGKRTSMHIHVNVSDMTNEQFKAFMYLAVCLEPVLMRYCADHRQSSNFCAPTYHSVNQVHVLSKLFQTEGDHHHFNRELIPKYAALGLYRLFDLGTVEFRMFEGTLSSSQVEAAVKLLHSIWEQALVSTVEELADRKRQQGVVSLLTPLLREVSGKFINQHEIEMTIERGVKMANDMVRPTMTMESMTEIHNKLFPTPEKPEPTIPSFPKLEGLTQDQSIIWGHVEAVANGDSINDEYLAQFGKLLGSALEVANFNSYVGYAINQLGMDNNNDTYEWVFDRLFKLAKYFESNCNALASEHGPNSVDRAAIYEYNV